VSATAYVKAEERRVQLVAAARVVLCRDGVAGTTLRGVAAEAGVALGTLHYVFPSKEQLITAVVQDIQAEVSAVFLSTEVGSGLEHAIRHGMDNYWQQLVVDQPELALMRHEVFIYALRTPGLERLARWQIEGYARIVSEGCKVAAGNAGEECAVPFDTLGRIVVGTVIGVVLHYLSDHDKDRARRDLEAATQMLLRLADVQPAAATGAG
jgi:AcrR family transcriptional regulator